MNRFIHMNKALQRMNAARRRKVALEGTGANRRSKRKADKDYRRAVMIHDLSQSSHMIFETQ